MSFRKTISRELEAAFSKRPQPAWFRLLKYFLLGAIICFFRGSYWLWIILGTLPAISMTLHFWYRYKTKGCDQGCGIWKHDGKK